MINPLLFLGREEVGVQAPGAIAIDVRIFVDLASNVRDVQPHQLSWSIDTGVEPRGSDRSKSEHDLIEPAMPRVHLDEEVGAIEVQRPVNEDDVEKRRQPGPCWKRRIERKLGQFAKFRSAAGSKPLHFIAKRLVTREARSRIHGQRQGPDHDAFRRRREGYAIRASGDLLISAIAAPGIHALQEHVGTASLAVAVGETDCQRILAAPLGCGQLDRMKTPVGTTLDRLTSYAAALLRPEIHKHWNPPRRDARRIRIKSRRKGKALSAKVKW